MPQLWLYLLALSVFPNSEHIAFHFAENFRTVKISCSKYVTLYLHVHFLLPVIHDTQFLFRPKLSSSALAGLERCALNSVSHWCVSHQRLLFVRRMTFQSSAFRWLCLSSPSSYLWACELVIRSFELIIFLLRRRRTLWSASGTLRGICNRISAHIYLGHS